MTRTVLVIVLLLLPGLAAAQEQKKSASDEMMQTYIEAAKPVAGHERLKAFTGKWNVAVKFWMAPGDPPMTAAGTATGRMILGGRFVQFEAKTEHPFPSESLTMLGFDRRTNDYTIVGFDNLGTYYITAAGKPEGPDVVLHGSYLQPPSMQEQKYRFVWESPSADEQVMTLYFALPEGKEMRVAEMRYTRAR
jgi:hypothetical protein